MTVIRSELDRRVGQRVASVIEKLVDVKTMGQLTKVGSTMIDIVMEEIARAVHEDGKVAVKPHGHFRCTMVEAHPSNLPGGVRPEFTDVQKQTRVVRPAHSRFYFRAGLAFRLGPERFANDRD